MHDLYNIVRTRRKQDIRLKLRTYAVISRRMSNDKLTLLDVMI